MMGDNDRGIDLFVPGRLCLFGEHSDWAGGHRRQNPEIGKGYTIVAPTNQGTYAKIRKLDEPIFKFKTVLSPDSFEVKLEEERLLKIAENGGFFSYVAGVAYTILSSYHSCLRHGIEIDNYKTDLPIKKGLSSSASVCVLVAKAFNEIYNLDLTNKRIMELAYLGETTTSSRCGKMDQACAYNNPVLMEFDGDKIRVEELKVGREFNLLIVDLKKGKDTVKILADLNKGFPWPVDENDLKKYKYLGEINKSIVMDAKKVLEEEDALKIGKIMVFAQESFDNYLKPSCLKELEAPVLHHVLEMPEIKEFVFGGKCVGSGGDGTAQFICKSREDREKVKMILESRGFGCLELDLKPTQKKDNLGMLLKELHRKVPIYGYIAPEENIDVGTIDLLKKAEEEALRERHNIQ
jgi:galactokinase